MLLDQGGVSATQSSPLTVIISDIDLRIVLKLEQMVTSIESWCRQCQMQCNVISTTRTTLNTTMAFLADVSSGETVHTLSGTIWPAVSHDAGKALTALEEVSTSLSAFKDTVNGLLPAIEAGIEVAQTARASQRQATPLGPPAVSLQQGQVDAMLAALAELSAAADQASARIAATPVGEACTVSFDQATVAARPGGSGSSGGDQEEGESHLPLWVLGLVLVLFVAGDIIVQLHRTIQFEADQRKLDEDTKHLETATEQAYAAQLAYKEALLKGMPPLSTANIAQVSADEASVDTAAQRLHNDIQSQYAPDSLLISSDYMNLRQSVNKLETDRKHMSTSSLSRKELAAAQSEAAQDDKQRAMALSIVLQDKNQLKRD